MNAEPLMTLVVKGSIVLTVFALGLHATARDATSLFREPARLARSIGSMSVVMPVVATLLVLAFDLRPAVNIALVALSVSPVPPIWPRKAIKAGGEPSYAIGLLVASAVLSVVIIPVTMEILHILFRMPLRMSATAVAELVLGTVLLPLLAGIATRSLAPTLARDAARPMMMVATIALALVAILLLPSLWQVMQALIGDGTLAVMFGFVIVGLLVGHRLGGPADEDRTVLALATATRHPGIAIAIARANFPAQRLVPAAIVLYLILSALMTLAYMRWAKRQSLAAPRRSPSVTQLRRDAERVHVPRR